MTAATCPACKGPKAPRQYLCSGCWWTLVPAARRALNRRDGMPAARRLGALLEQLKAGTPLHRIEITP